jgi:murein DD-endopeptidase MepM/ murein hydrolase activator NlpD
MGIPLELPPTPEERAASERRLKILRVAAGSGAAAVLVGAAVAAPLIADRPEPPRRIAAAREDPDAAPPAAPEDAGARSDDPNVVVKRGRVGRGGTLLGALTAQGLTNAAAHELVDALDSRFDPRRSRPEDTFELRLDRASGQVREFEYVVGPTEIYEVEREDDGRLRGRRREIEVAVVRRAVGATLQSSLWNAIERAGLRGSILETISDVLASDLNLFSDPRRGDVFRVIVEEERVAGRFLRYRAPEALEYEGAKVGRVRAFRYRDARGNADYYDDTGRSMHKSLLRTPLRFVRISSRFDMHRMHPVLHTERAHLGVDYAAPPGTPVWATAAGRVIVCGPAGAAGNLVEIDHGSGLVSLYMHLLRFAAGLRVGDTVRQRQVIGYVGATGRVTGPHLHFAIKKNGRFVNPLEVALQPGRPLPAGEAGRFRERKDALSRDLAAIRVVTGEAAPDAGP